MIYTRLRVTALLGLFPAANGVAGESALEPRIRSGAAAVESKLIAWRRDIHQHPELGDQEARTAALVAEHLRGLGLEVRTGVARTGVVGILKGGQPGKCVALRADMDALPVKEATGLAFASQAKGTWNGREVEVMHACGHDAHTAMLMATAEVLAGMRADLPGSVEFLFQPSEEGSSLVTAASGQSWGAKRMLEEGVFTETKPVAVFGLHVMPGHSGEIMYHAGPAFASSDELEIVVTGREGHGGVPWKAVDPITTAAQIVTGLQTVVSRRTDLTASPAVVTIGTINGGTRFNIIPDAVRMTGTIRAYDEEVRAKLAADIRLTAEKIAESAGAHAEVHIARQYDPTINDETLTARMLPVLRRATDDHVTAEKQRTGAEDFSCFARVTPGLYVNLGVTPRDQDPATAAPNHSSKFWVDEAALVVGVRVMGSLAVNALEDAKK